MNAKRYPLRFSIASRTLVSFPLSALHVDAFDFKGSDVTDALPPGWFEEAEAVILHGIPTTEPRPSLEHLGGMLCYTMSMYTHYRTDLSGSFEHFLASKSGKTRSTLRRKVRKLAAANGENLDWREFRSPEDVSEFFSLAGPLAEQTYQARLFDGALPLDNSFRAQAMGLASEGLLRCYILFLGSKPVAYLYAPIEGQTAIYAYLGYDERHAALSPGTVLQYLVHERLFHDPEVHWFDFTEGEGPHKALFASERRQRCNLLFMQKNLFNRCLLGAHSGWNHLVEKAKKNLKRR